MSVRDEWHLFDTGPKVDRLMWKFVLLCIPASITAFAIFIVSSVMANR